MYVHAWSSREKVSGQILLDYLKPRLFDLLEIFKPPMAFVPYGHRWPQPAYVNDRGVSRLGIMLLQKGVYKGRQIVAADYVKRMRRVGGYFVAHG